LILLFAGQFVLPQFSPMFPSLAFGLGAEQIHPVFSIVYLAVGAALFLQRPGPIVRMLGEWLPGAKGLLKLVPKVEETPCAGSPEHCPSMVQIEPPR